MKQKYIDLVKSLQESDDFWKESAIADFTNEVCRLMEEKGITRKELAKRLGHSPPYVTKALRGDNFTIATMAKFARALDAVVRIHLAPDGAVVTWEEQEIAPASLAFLGPLEAKTGGALRPSLTLVDGTSSRSMSPIPAKQAFHG